MKFIVLDIIYVYTITIKEKLGMSYHATPPMPCTSFLRYLSCLGEYGLTTPETLPFSIYQISGRDFPKGGELSWPQKIKHVVKNLNNIIMSIIQASRASCAFDYLVIIHFLCGLSESCEARSNFSM
jgi:hypothetical protein